MKPPDFIEAPLTIERIKVVRIARCELACLKITAAEVCITKRLGTLSREKMKTKPAPVHARNSLRFSKERDKQEQNEISIDLRLELKIARKIFRCDFARSSFELKRRVQRVIEFLDEHDQRPDIAVTQAGAWIVLLELFD